MKAARPDGLPQTRSHGPGNLSTGFIHRDPASFLAREPYPQFRQR